MAKPYPRGHDSYSQFHAQLLAEENLIVRQGGRAWDPTLVTLPLGPYLSYRCQDPI
uniref:Uncharacterized protein n=1 Tax=Nelumbo nucifera TaxID=4432 RepID=A0A822YEJ2_NELNU|nr:TPA_asm: hypothetical protein HUJ06_009663 [Nelumbo nucifera]